MIAWIGAIFLYFGFFIVAVALRVPKNGMKIYRAAKESIAILSDHSLEHFTKERSLNTYTIHLMALSSIVIGGAVLSIGLPIGLLWVVDYMGLASFEDVLQTAFSGAFLFLVTIIAAAIWFLVRRK